MASQETAPQGSPRAVFGAMLRYYRTKAGLKQDELAALVHVSGALIGAYETGKRVPTRPTVADIDALAELGTNGSLIQLWDQFEHGMNYQAFPAWVQDWAETVESAAVTLRWYETVYVPGLLQTEDYMRALFATRFGITPDDIEQQVAARLKRQEILSRPAPPALWVIMDETAVRRPVGGRYVMAEQLARLIDAASKPHIRIALIELSTGAHEGLNGAFEIADPEDGPSAGYQEGAVSGQVITERRDVARLDLMWSTLKDEALPRGASLALLEEVKKSWTSQA